MFDPTIYQPLERFNQLAVRYAAGRPDYPDAAINRILAGLDQSNSHILDLGCGTGIMTRQLATRGYRVTGIEPNAEMRSVAEATLAPGTIRYLAGQAEATGLPDASCDRVVVAQAFHWFEASPALKEIARVLVPRGQVFLVWNEWDAGHPTSVAFFDIIKRYASQPEVIREPHSASARHLQQSDLFSGLRVECVPNRQILNREGWIHRALSISFAPKLLHLIQTCTQELLTLFDRCRDGDTAELRYQTLLFSAVKSSGTK